MSEKNSEAKKRFWANLSPQERSRRMSSLATKGQKKLTFSERRAIGLKMAAAKKLKAQEKVRARKSMI